MESQRNIELIGFFQRKRLWDIFFWKRMDVLLFLFLLVINQGAFSVALANAMEVVGNEYP
jgi:hypothetical protein